MCGGGVDVIAGAVAIAIARKAKFIKRKQFLYYSADAVLKTLNLFTIGPTLC